MINQQEKFTFTPNTHLGSSTQKYTLINIFTDDDEDDHNNNYNYKGYVNKFLKNIN
jgi:hypothetical protein